VIQIKMPHYVSVAHPIIFLALLSIFVVDRRGHNNCEKANGSNLLYLYLFSGMFSQSFTAGCANPTAKAKILSRLLQISLQLLLPQRILAQRLIYRYVAISELNWSKRILHCSVAMKSSNISAMP